MLIGEGQHQLARWLGWLLMSVALTNCVHPSGAGSMHGHRDSPSPPSGMAESGVGSVDADVGFDGSLERYVAVALAKQPRLRATYERWHAAAEQSSAAGQLPAVNVSYGYFIRSVETRVGPQRHRVSVSQTFPWPGELRSMRSASTAEADAWRRYYEASALDVRERVVAAYWRLWLVRERQRIVRAQVEVTSMLVETARARVAVGTTSLADVQRLELDRARLRDDVAGGDVQARVESAGLAAAVGIAPGELLPTQSRSPRLAAPAESREQLVAAAAEHPRLAALDSLAQSADDQAEAQRRRAWPSLRLGVDWIETGRGMSTADDAGKDPIMVQLGVMVPLSQGRLAHEADAARAMARSRRAEKGAALLDSVAAVDQALARIDDALRRAHLYETTLVPQAQGTLDAVLGGYAGGRGGVVDVLSAERELLQIQLDLAQAHADLAVAWAQLERWVGRTVSSEAVDA